MSGPKLGELRRVPNAQVRVDRVAERVPPRCQVSEFGVVRADDAKHVLTLRELLGARFSVVGLDPLEHLEEQPVPHELVEVHHVRRRRYRTAATTSGSSSSAIATSGHRSSGSGSPVGT